MVPEEEESDRKQKAERASHRFFNNLKGKKSRRPMEDIRDSEDSAGGVNLRKLINPSVIH